MAHFGQGLVSGLRITPTSSSPNHIVGEKEEGGGWGWRKGVVSKIWVKRPHCCGDEVQGRLGVAPSPSSSSSSTTSLVPSVLQVPMHYSRALCGRGERDQKTHLLHLVHGRGYLPCVLNEGPLLSSHLPVLSGLDKTTKGQGRYVCVFLLYLMGPGERNDAL